MSFAMLWKGILENSDKLASLLSSSFSTTSYMIFLRTKQSSTLCLGVWWNLQNWSLYFSMMGGGSNTLGNTKVLLQSSTFMLSFRIFSKRVNFQSYDQPDLCFLAFADLFTTIVLLFLVSSKCLDLDTPEVLAIILCIGFTVFLMMASRAPFFIPILIYFALSMRPMNNFTNVLDIKFFGG